MHSDEDRGPPRDEAARPTRDPETLTSQEPSREVEASPGLDDLLGVLWRESTLWPLLIVIVASFGALGAGLFVLSVVDRNPFAAGALILLVGMTLDLLWRARRRPRLRNLARSVGVIWLAALALAGLAVWLGIA